MSLLTTVTILWPFIPDKFSGFFLLFFFFVDKLCLNPSKLRQAFRFSGILTSRAGSLKATRELGSSSRYLETAGATRPFWQVWTRTRAMDDSGIIRRRRLQVRTYLPSLFPKQIHVITMFWTNVWPLISPQTHVTCLLYVRIKYTDTQS